MAISGMSSAGFHAPSQQALQSLSHLKHVGHQGQSLADATSSSVASAPNRTGKIGSKIDVTA